MIPKILVAITCLAVLISFGHHFWRDHQLQLAAQEVAAQAPTEMRAAEEAALRARQEECKAKSRRESEDIEACIRVTEGLSQIESQKVLDAILKP